MNVGEKYIIEIAEITTGAESGNKRARIKGFDGLYLDRNGINKLRKYDPKVEYKKGYEARKTEESKSAEMLVTGDKEMLEREYQRGLDDAWECARKMEYMLFNQPQFNDCFGNTDFYSVLTKMTVSEAKEIIREYEEREKRNSCGDCSHLDTGTAEYCNGYSCKDYDKHEPKQIETQKATKQFAKDLDSGFYGEKYAIKAGDEILYTDAEEYDTKAVVMDVDQDGVLWILDENACAITIKSSEVKRTGRHFEGVDSLLQRMRD